MKWKNPANSPRADDIQCQCNSDQSESCNKCNSQLNSVCDSESENVSQDDTDISQSEQLLENEELTSQSTASTQQSLEKAVDESETLTETSPSNGAKLSDHNKTLRILSKDVKWRHKSMLMLEGLKSSQSSESTQRKKPNSYSEMLEQNYLEFSEHLTQAVGW